MADLVSNRGIIAAGAFGGVAPSLVRGATYLLGHEGAMPALTGSQYVGYSLAAVVMMAVGAVVALTTADPRTIRSAFALGMTLPSFFQVGGLQNDAKADQAAATSVVGLPFIASAMAQPIPDRLAAMPDLSTGRKLEISTPNSAASDQVAAVFLDKNSKAVSSVPAKRGFTSVDVPPNAASVRFEKGSAVSESQPLTNSSASVETAEVKVRGSATGAFLQAVGLSRDAKPTIDAQVTAAAKLPVGTAGWCYLGERGPDGWRTRYVDFPGEDVPQPGAQVVINFPLNVRADSPEGKIIGVAHAAQKLRIDKIQNNGNRYWASVTVLE